MPGAVQDHVLRTVTENCRTLKVTSQASSRCSKRRRCLRLRRSRSYGSTPRSAHAHRETSLHRDTTILQAGYRGTTEAGPFLDGPQFAATYTAPGDPAKHRLTYGRFDNPTWIALEEALGVLKGGHALSSRRAWPQLQPYFGVCLEP